METSTDKTIAAGRYAFQARAEQFMVADVIANLSPRANATFLEIGCGPGLLLAAFAPRVASCTGVDNAGQLALARATSDAALIAGRFEELEFSEHFDLILIYSVIHCLPDFAAVSNFVAKAAALLNPGGRLLVGDIPNSDLKRAFLVSEAGAAFHREWAKQVSTETTPPPLDRPGIGAFSEAQIKQIAATLDRPGYTTKRLSQPKELPFGHTREDILITRASLSRHGA